MVDRSILCNCGLEADNHHLLKSLAACNTTKTKLKMYFTINLAFTNYLNEISNLTDHHSIDRSITEYEQVLPIHINVTGTNFDSSLYSRPSRLRDFIYKHMQDNSQEIFFCKKAYTTHITTLQKFLFICNSKKYFYIYILYNLNDYNNISRLLVLQTQTY